MRRALQAGGARLVAFDDNPKSVEAARAEGIATGDLHDLDWSAVEALVTAEPVGELLLKGFARPVSAFNVLGLRDG